MRMIVALPLSVLLLANEAGAATTQSNRIAYGATLKCAIANGLAEMDEGDVGHPGQQADYKARTRRSFDLAYRLGAKIGLTDEQVQHDLDGAKETELTHMMGERSYYLGIVATCKTMGQM